MTPNPSPNLTPTIAPTNIPWADYSDDCDSSRSQRELLEERIAFGNSKLKVARLLLDTLDQQNEDNNLSEVECDLMYKAIDSVLYAF